MANNATALSGLPTQGYAYSTDWVIAYSPTSNLDVRIQVANLYSNAVIYAANIVFTNNSTPVNSVAPGVLGTVWFDNNYAYFQVANTTIKRVALSSF